MGNDMPYSEEKTTVRTNKSGIKTQKMSFWSFPKDMHQMVKDRVARPDTVCDFYSEAIKNLRHDFDSGELIFFKKTPKEGINVNLWVLEEARDSIEYLSEKTGKSHTSVVYTAMVRHFAKELTNPDTF